MSNSIVSPTPSQENNGITPLFGEFIAVPYNPKEAPYFQQFDGEEHHHLEDFTNKNSDFDVVEFLVMELQDYSDYCVRLVDGYWHVCLYDWPTDTLVPLFPCFNRASAFMNAIALMSRSEQYRAEADEPLPFEIEYEKQRLANWNATVRATLSVMDNPASAEQGGAE